MAALNHRILKRKNSFLLHRFQQCRLVAISTHVGSPEKLQLEMDGTQARNEHSCVRYSTVSEVFIGTRERLQQQQRDFIHSSKT